MHSQQQENQFDVTKTGARKSSGTICTSGQAEKDKPRRKSRAENAMVLTRPMRKLSIASRRSSYCPSRSGSIVDLNSVMNAHVRGQEKMENTYQLAPSEGHKFNAGKVEKLISGILNSYLDGEDYENRKVNLLVKSLSDVIKSRVKEMDFPRYKIVCFVTIGQLGNQTLEQASRCVWNAETDTFAQTSYRNSSLFCTATVYGVYLD